ncbi:hypothetical protein ACJX0J_031632 [Zea mays]
MFLKLHEHILTGLLTHIKFGRSVVAPGLMHFSAGYFILTIFFFSYYVEKAVILYSFLLMALELNNHLFIVKILGTTLKTDSFISRLRDKLAIYYNYPCLENNRQNTNEGTNVIPHGMKKQALLMLDLHILKNTLDISMLHGYADTPPETANYDHILGVIIFYRVS